MKKILAPVVASAMLLGATTANAETRPEATRFSQPVAQDASQVEGDAIWLLILALAAIIAGIIIATNGDGNSPN